MSDLLSIYKELQAKKWVDLSHQINADSQSKLYLEQTRYLRL